MASSIATLNAILKEFYLAPIAEQINQEVLVYELFEKSTVAWSGKTVVIPAHISRNTAVGVITEGGAMPAGGNFPPMPVNYTPGAGY